jgi:hypothetical protein
MQRNQRFRIQADKSILLANSQHRADRFHEIRFTFSINSSSFSYKYELVFLLYICQPKCFAVGIIDADFFSDTQTFHLFFLKTRSNVPLAEIEKSLLVATTESQKLLLGIKYLWPKLGESPQPFLFYFIGNTEYPGLVLLVLICRYIYFYTVLYFFASYK